MARRHDAWLMVDDAHGLGVLGATGAGIFEQTGVDPREVDIWMGTLSKTLCGCGGFIAGNRDLVDWLRHSAPGFVYSVGMPPPLAAASMEALRIFHAEPERVTRLQANATLFRDALRARGFDTGTSAGAAIIPLITGSSIGAARLSAALFARAINVQPILFPAVAESSARLRFFLSADHTPAELRLAASTIASAALDAAQAA